MVDDLVILPIDAGMLQATFPRWEIFEAAGWWFAIRRAEHAEVYAGPRSLLRHTLRASSVPVLAELLAIQDFLDSRPAAELDQIYRRAGQASAAPEGNAGAIAGSCAG